MQWWDLLRSIEGKSSNLYIFLQITGVLLLFHGWRTKDPKWKKTSQGKNLLPPCLHLLKPKTNSLGSHSGHTFVNPQTKVETSKCLFGQNQNSGDISLLRLTINLVWVWSLFWFWACLCTSSSCGHESLDYDLGLVSKLKSLFLSFQELFGLDLHCVGCLS